MHGFNIILTKITIKAKSGNRVTVYEKQSQEAFYKHRIQNKVPMLVFIKNQKILQKLGFKNIIIQYYKKINVLIHIIRSQIRISIFNI